MRSPADAYFTENSPELSTSPEWPARPPPPSVSVRFPHVTVPHGHVGRYGAAGQRLVYNPADFALAAAQLDPRLRGAAVEGEGGDRTSGLGLSAGRWRGDRDARRERGESLGRRAAAKCRRLPGRRDHGPAVNAGDVPRGSSTSTTGTGCGARSARTPCTPRSTTSRVATPGSVVNISGAAVLASSKHRSAAQRFVGFLVSRNGQELIRSGDDFEYPVRPGVPPNPQEPPLSRIAHTSISALALGNDVRASQMIVNAGFGA